MEPKTPSAADLQAAADQSTLTSLAASMADHPGIPQVMREALPAIIRAAQQRDSLLSDLVASVEQLREQVAQLVAGTQSAGG